MPPKKAALTKQASERGIRVDGKHAALAAKEKTRKALLLHERVIISLDEEAIKDLIDPATGEITPTPNQRALDWDHVGNLLTLRFDALKQFDHPIRLIVDDPEKLEFLDERPEDLPESLDKYEGPFGGPLQYVKAGSAIFKTLAGRHRLQAIIKGLYDTKRISPSDAFWVADIYSPELYKPEHQEIYDELGANDDEEHQAETPGNCFAFLYREYIGSEKKIDTFSWETIKTSQNYKRWARGLTKGSNAPLKETGSQVVMLAAIKAMGDEVLQEMAECYRYPDFAKVTMTLIKNLSAFGCDQIFRAFMQSFLFSHHLLCGLPDPAVRRDHKVVTSKMYTQCTQSAVDAISASIGTLKGDIGVDLWRTRANQILEQANLPVMDYSGESANSKAVLKAARERWIAMERGNTTPADAVASYNVPKMLFGLPHATTQYIFFYSQSQTAAGSYGTAWQTGRSSKFFTTIMAALDLTAVASGRAGSNQTRSDVDLVRQVIAKVSAAQAKLGEQPSASEQAAQPTIEDKVYEFMFKVFQAGATKAPWLVRDSLESIQAYALTHEIAERLKPAIEWPQKRARADSLQPEEPQPKRKKENDAGWLAELMPVMEGLDCMVGYDPDHPTEQQSAFVEQLKSDAFARLRKDEALAKEIAKEKVKIEKLEQEQKDIEEAEKLEKQEEREAAQAEKEKRKQIKEVEKAAKLRSREGSPAPEA